MRKRIVTQQHPCNSRKVQSQTASIAEDMKRNISSTSYEETKAMKTFLNTAEFVYLISKAVFFSTFKTILIFVLEK